MEMQPLDINRNPIGVLTPVSFADYYEGDEDIFEEGVYRFAVSLKYASSEIIGGIIDIGDAEVLFFDGTIEYFYIPQGTRVKFSSITAAWVTKMK